VGKFLSYEREQNPPLATLPAEELKAAQMVRCQISGRFGRLTHVHRAEQPAILVTWDNGSESRHLLRDTDNILCWRERLLQ
jgi:hypothetical protein